MRGYILIYSTDSYPMQIHIRTHYILFEYYLFYVSANGFFSIIKTIKNMMTKLIVLLLKG